MMHSVRFGRLSSVLSVVTACCIASVAFAQTSQPAGKPTSMPTKFSHEAMMKIVESKPLVVVEPKNKKGNPLTPQQKEELSKSNALLKEAEELRAKGDFAAAMEKATSAFNIRSSILGLENTDTVTAKILGQSLSKWTKMPKEAQTRLAEALKQLDSTQQLEDEGKSEEAVTVAKKASATFKELLGAEDVQTGAAQLRLGAILTNASQLDESDKALKNALSIYKAVYGEDHPKIAAVLDRIGWMGVVKSTSSSTPDPDGAQAAIDSLMKAVQILNKTQGETAETAESLDNLGTALAYVGNMRNATECKLRALVIRERLLGPEAKDTAVSLSNLAWVYIQLQQLDEALKLRQRALAIFEKSLPPTHPYINVERQHLATAYALAGRVNDSLALYETMVEADRKNNQTLDPDAIGRLTRLGAIYLEAGRREQGDTTLAKAASLGKDLYNSGKQDQALSVLEGVAGIYQQRRRYQDAAAVLEICTGWDEKTRNAGDSFEKVQRASRLGAVYADLGRFDDAKKVLTDVIERIKKAAGKDDLKVAGPMMNLADVHEKEGKFDEAERLYDDVVQISETKLGRKAIGTAYAVISLGKANRLQKRYDLAKFSLEEACETMKLYEQQDPTGNIRAIRELGVCYYLAGDKDKEKGMTMLRDALSRARETNKKSPNVHTNALLADTLKELIDATEKDSALEKDRNEWRGELKTLLEKLKTESALDADETNWLKELG